MRYFGSVTPMGNTRPPDLRVPCDTHAVLTASHAAFPEGPGMDAVCSTSICALVTMDLVAECNFHVSLLVCACLVAGRPAILPALFPAELQYCAVPLADVRGKHASLWESCAVVSLLGSCTRAGRATVWPMHWLTGVTTWQRPR